MQTSLDNEVLIIRLHPGEDFHSSMEAALEKYGIDSAVIAVGIGMMTDFELSYFAGKEEGYDTQHHVEPHELTSMQGTAARNSKGKMMIHVHVNLAGSDHKVIGGHLNRGTVWVLNEIAVYKISKAKMIRELNPETDLWELQVG